MQLAISETTHPNGARERTIILMDDAELRQHRFDLIRAREDQSELPFVAVSLLDPSPAVVVEPIEFPPPDAIATIPALSRPEPPPDSPETSTFFIMRRTNGAWDIDARPVEIVRGDQDHAEKAALRWKTRYPAQTFGTALLLSEARIVEKPIETVSLQ